MKFVIRKTEDNGIIYERLLFCCPGCEEFGGSGFHGLPINTSEHSPSWTFDGNLGAPTISPSILSRYREGDVCHSYIENGKIRFLGDCTHSLANQTVDTLELPEWVQNAT